MNVASPPGGEDGSGRPDILRWIPSTWDLFVGNRRLNRFLKRLLLAIRQHVQDGRVRELNKLCFLLTGPSRSGKTATISFFVRCVVCQLLDMETLNPCDGRCEACRERPEFYGDRGILTILRNPQQTVRVHFQVIDATMIGGPQDLRDKVLELREFDGIRIVYVDEVHRLVRREMDEILLKAIEQKGFIWIFSTAKPENLEDMFLNRLIKLSTELPEAGELEQWIADRCDEWRINWYPDAVMRVVEKSNRVVGTALHALALAALNPEEGLTLDLVENDWDVQIEK
jgi:hypothetical protein